ALSAAVMTVLMGLIGNTPLALAAGLGVNGIVAFQMAPAMTWAQAFGLVVLEGVCIVLMAVSGVRERIMNAIPRALKIAITVGVGGWGRTDPTLPSHVLAAPDFDLFGRVDLFGGFASAGALTATIFLFTLVLSGFFDAMGTITSVSDGAGLSRNGKVPRMGRIL